MNLLAIDTSTEYLSLAVMRNGKIAAKMHKKAAMAHSSLLVPMIAKVLKKAKLILKDLDGFAISIGPGSFTGLRIGVATVKGLAMALDRPIVTVPTLDVIAENIKGFRGTICPVLDARKKKVYACLYRSDGENIKRASKYLLIPTADLEKRLEKVRGDILFLGDAIEAGKEPNPGWHPRAEVVAALGAEMFKKRRFVKAEELEPMYLYSRECDITGK